MLIKAGGGRVFEEDRRSLSATVDGSQEKPMTRIIHIQPSLSE